MRYLVRLAFLLAFTTAIAADLRPELKPFSFFVGSCWTGTFPGGKTTDTHCFESMFDGQFVRDRHKVSGGSYEGETVYWWDKGTNRITYTYWASDGGVSSGIAEIDGDTIVFPEEYRAKDGGTQSMRNVWKRRGADSYDVVVSKKNADGWQETWRMTLRRDGTE